ncbi:MAG TPA: diadenylate cyclase CdaA [Bacteroidia bacterium]|nr:diadenylate cyclase CdaA [Bacteroidia bacterium]
MLSFLSFELTDLIDILLVAVMLYLAYNLVKGTSAINIFIGLALIYFTFIVLKAFDLKLLSSILGKFVNVGVIAIMIVFQQEIRKFLLYIGTSGFLRKNWKNIFKLNVGSTTGNQVVLDIDAISQACINMSESKTGALIVIGRKSDLKFFVSTGEVIDSSLSDRMLENIFFKNSPLHDGAVIIQENRIVAARCVLPVSENTNFPVHYGMRHRAAAGITENTDAIAITVSEQTGGISLTINGEINADLNREKLIYLLEKNLYSLT